MAQAVAAPKKVAAVAYLLLATVRVARLLRMNGSFVVSLRNVLLSGPTLTGRRANVWKSDPRSLTGLGNDSQSN
jgi:hypothetical protein